MTGAFVVVLIGLLVTLLLLMIALWDLRDREAGAQVLLLQNRHLAEQVNDLRELLGLPPVKPAAAQPRIPEQRRRTVR